MTLSVTNLKTRMNREFALLGVTSTGDEKDDILCDGVSEFVDIMDVPVISATLAVTSGITSYSIPATIRKIQDVRDADSNSVVFSIDETISKIVLQDDPDTGNYTVYGTPEDIRTNISTIVTAIKTEYERVLWAFVRWAAYAWGNDDTADQKLKSAEYMAKRARKNRNLSLDPSGVTVKSLDTANRNIADINNKENLNVDIEGLFDADL